MGLKKFLITCLALLIFAVMRSEADCNSDLSQCSLHLAALSSLSTGEQPATADQIQQYCPNIATFQTCLNNVPENCKNDPAYSGFQQSATTYSGFCSGSGTGGTGTGCAVMDCMQILSNVGGDPNAQPGPEPEPENSMDTIMKLCGAYENFKTCVATKSQNCPESTMATVKNVTDSQKKMCEGECALNKVFQCVKNVNLDTLKDITGFPTKEQIQPLCSAAKPVMSCLTNFFSKCESNVDAETKKGMEQMEMSKKMLTVFCQDVFPAIMKEDFECVRNKTMLAEVDKCSSTDLTQVRDESQAEMCGRLEKEKMCIKDASVKYCDEKVASDFSNLFVKVMTTMSNQNYECNGATSGFQINLWISMLMAAVLLAFLM